jgi:hypothetical protein
VLRPSLARILFATTVVAVADMADAVLVWVVILQRSSLQRILQSVASGVLGPAALRGGWATALLGLGLHVCVAAGWTLVFLVLLNRSPRVRRWVATTRGAIRVGLAYGALVWLLMDGVVLPLSRARVVSPTAPWFWIQLLTHPLVVGIPIVVVLSGANAREHAALAIPVARPVTEDR